MEGRTDGRTDKVTYRGASLLKIGGIVRLLAKKITTQLYHNRKRYVNDIIWRAKEIMPFKFICF